MFVVIILLVPFSYYDEIKNPMDFGTIGARLKKGHYSTMEEFARDVGLIFANCRQFNPPGTHPVLNAEVVEKVFKREWPKALEKKLSFKEKRSLMSTMTKLMSDGTWVPLFFHLSLGFCRC